jgi:hypothetical protein
MGIKDDLVKKLSRKTSIDPRVVRLVIDYPIKFTRDRMSDPEDERPVRIRYFAVFIPKSAGHEYEKSDKIGQNRWKPKDIEEQGKV